MIYTKDDLARLGSFLYGDGKKDYEPKLASLLGMTERHLRRVLNGTQDIPALRQGQIERLFELSGTTAEELRDRDLDGDE